MTKTHYYDNFRRLTCDVYNPGYDKRRRYGEGAVEFLKEGTALYEFTRHPVDKLSLGSISWNESSSIYTTQGFGKALLENSIICEPKSWRERVRFATGSSTRAPAGIIDQLVESGVITPEQVETAAIEQDKE
jgi:hypothetical protein